MKPAATNWLLVLHKAGKRGESFKLSQGATTIGRDPSNAIPLPHSSVSRQHAEIVCGPNGVTVRDLDSRNAILVNGDIEPGECNLLHLALMNKLAGVVSGVSATLSSTNAGVSITQPFSNYPDLPASGMKTNATPFQISTSPSLICGTNIDLVLTVHTATNGSFSVPSRVFTGTPGRGPCRWGPVPQ